MYLYFTSFFDKEITRVDEILPEDKDPFMPWLLMTWRLKEPGTSRHGTEPYGLTYFDIIIRDGIMMKPCLPRVVAQLQMTFSFVKPYLSLKWRYCDVMVQQNKTPQWVLGDHLRYVKEEMDQIPGLRCNYREPLVTLLYLMCWWKRFRTFPWALIRRKNNIFDIIPTVVCRYGTVLWCHAVSGHLALTCKQFQSNFLQEKVYIGQ